MNSVYKKPMKLLVTADPFIPVPPIHYGGIERIVDLLIKGLKQSGHEVGLLAHPDSNVDVDQQWSWPQCDPQSTRQHWANGWALRRTLKMFKPDLIHSFSRLAYLILAGHRSIPRLMSYQREPSSRTVGLTHRIFKDQIQFSGCSEYIAQRGRRSAGHWHALHNFIDLDLYDFKPQVADDAPLVFLSRVEDMKGPDLAIKMAREAGRRLIIAGNHADHGPQAAFFKNKVQPLLGGDVEYIGAVDDHQKNELLGQAAAMLVPIQWHEPFGIVFVEAMACGTPVITSPRGALPEIVETGTHGFLVESHDQGVQAISQLNSIDRAQCRQRVERHFSMQAMVPQYIDLYQSMLTHVRT